MPTTLNIYYFCLGNMLCHAPGFTMADCNELGHSKQSAALLTQDSNLAPNLTSSLCQCCLELHSLFSTDYASLKRHQRAKFMFV